MAEDPKRRQLIFDRVAYCFLALVGAKAGYFTATRVFQVRDSITVIIAVAGYAALACGLYYLTRRRA